MTNNKEQALKLFMSAARKFIQKVETGQARSQVTYRELKEALRLAEKE